MLSEYVKSNNYTSKKPKYQMQFSASDTVMFRKRLKRSAKWQKSDLSKQ
jgi:hypothetical protein